MSLALPHTSCNAPSGKMPEATISLTMLWATYEVNVAGFTIAGTPASKLQLTFSSMPQMGKL